MTLEKSPKGTIIEIKFNDGIRSSERFYVLFTMC